MGSVFSKKSGKKTAKELDKIHEEKMKEFAKKVEAFPNLEYDYEEYNEFHKFTHMEGIKAEKT